MFEAWKKLWGWFASIKVNDINNVPYFLPGMDTFPHAIDNSEKEIGFHMGFKKDKPSEKK